MFGLFKKAKEYNKLAQSMNAIYGMLQLVTSKASIYNRDQYYETVITMAYIAKRGVMDRVEKNQYPLTSKIVVPLISTDYIILLGAMAETVGAIRLLAEKLLMTDDVEEVMRGGKLYYDVEKVLPDDAKNWI
jgi:acyl CoA:acetate/3-ketoacid CoA transferase beta subunit